MAITKMDIRQWLKEAKKNGCSHLIVVCDTFDHEDYPVFVYPKGKAPKGSEGSVYKVVEKYNGPNMQRVMEVYDLSKDIETQLNVHHTGLEFLNPKSWRAVVEEFDPSYFDYFDEEDADLSLEDAAGHLATWIYDQVDPAQARKELKKYVPEKLYVLAVEKYLDGDHDT